MVPVKFKKLHKWFKIFLMGKNLPKTTTLMKLLHMVRQLKFPVLSDDEDRGELVLIDINLFTLVVEIGRWNMTHLFPRNPRILAIKSKV
jgi:hypothetical protein